jgi:acetylcholinesterase
MHSSAMLFFVILPLVFCPMALAGPEVNIGRTTLVGRDVTGLKQDFFGGMEQSFNG